MTPFKQGPCHVSPARKPLVSPLLPGQLVWPCRNTRYPNGSSVAIIWGAEPGRHAGQPSAIAALHYTRCNPGRVDLWSHSELRMQTQGHERGSDGGEHGHRATYQSRDSAVLCGLRRFPARRGRAVESAQEYLRAHIRGRAAARPRRRTKMIWRRRKARSPRPPAGARVTLQGDHLAGIIIDEGGEIVGRYYRDTSMPLRLLVDSRDGTIIA